MTPGSCPYSLPGRLRPARRFRRQFRANLRKALRAAKSARFKCAYAPGAREINKAASLLEEAMKMCSPSRWGD